MNPKVKGYLFGIVAAASYGTNPLFALPLYKAGMNPDSVLFFRYLVAIPILALMIRARRRSFRIGRGKILPLVAMGLLVALSSLTLFESYNHMEAGIASTLLFVYPIMVAVIMALFYHERMSLQTVLCIALALGGIALLYKSGDGTTLSTTGIALVAVSAAAYAIYIVGANRPALKEMPTVTMTFYVLVFGLALFAGRIAATGNLILPPTWYLWADVLALALFPTAISFLCTTQAIQSIGSTNTAILGALEPLTAVFFGVTVFGETLTPRLCCGIVLILAAVTFIVAGDEVSAIMVRFRKLFPKLPSRGRTGR